MLQVTVSLHILELDANRTNVCDSLLGMDKGGADLVADGRIKVKSGVSAQRFTKTGLVLSDSTELPADVVIFAYVHLVHGAALIF